MSGQKLFSFQKMNKYFLMPFFVPIICFSTKFFSEAMKLNDDEIDIKDVSVDNTHTFVFLYQIIQSISLILGGLYYFIQHKQLKSKKVEINAENDDKNSEISNDEVMDDKLNIKFVSRVNTETTMIGPKTKKIITKERLIIIIMPLFWIAYNLGIAYAVGYPQLEKRLYFLFFFTLINIYIFKKPIFRHQKLALIITLIGAIPIYIAFGLFLDTEIYNILYDIFLFIGSFCYSLFLVSIKYITQNKGTSVFLLLLYQGTLSFIYTLIIYIIISLIMKGELTYITNIFHCDENNYICFSFYYFKIIMYIIFNTTLQTLIFFVVYIFSPELFAISDIFSPLFSLIAKWIKFGEANGIKVFLYVLGYLIIAFGSFIYNEFIILNFCKLNENTWKSIYNKAADESSSINRNYLIMKNDKDFYDYEDYDVKSEKDNKNGYSSRISIEMGSNNSSFMSSD
mgnify:FL=1